MPAVGPAPRRLARAPSARVPRARGLVVACCGLALGGCTGGAGGGAGPGPTGGTPIESVARTTRCAPAPAVTLVEAPPGSGSAAPAPPGAVRVRRDLPFAALGADTLRLDLAVPAGPGLHPVVVLLHGGGWEGGHRSAMHDAMRVLAARGFAAATVSYRLTRGRRDVFPAAVQDARCAVRWLRASAAAHALDGARIGALGFSAGAHLASLLGTAPDVAALDQPPDVARGTADAAWRCLAPTATSPAVQAVVSAAGPQDLRVQGPYTREQARLVTNFLGVFPGDAPAVAALASPIAHVRPQAPPFLLVHGTRDELVPVAHARRMRDALHAVGTPATVLELRGEGHVFPALDAAERPEVGCTAVAFLDRWLRGR